ncbi:MAG: prepilin-type N-terminal cleavage/methylation domain-containing protein [Lachnospiraceae bacterium]|nr:prepilin-type N-terminal cleavage/methylation domain-containing protein [Lachnospiraceae bacterium]
MKKDNKGFSLVELIIVIAIMAVLIGILAPQYLKYVNKSKVSTDITNAQEIQAAFSAAIADGQITAAGSQSGVGGAAITNVENMDKFPVSRVDATQQWVVTYTLKDGVTSITLGGDQVYPDAAPYQAAH